MACEKVVSTSHYPDTIVVACDDCGGYYLAWSPWPGVVPYNGTCCSRKSEKPSAAIQDRGPIAINHTGHASGVRLFDWGR